MLSETSTSAADHDARICLLAVYQLSHLGVMRQYSRLGSCKWQQPPQLDRLSSNFIDVKGPLAVNILMSRFYLGPVGLVDIDKGHLCMEVAAGDLSKQQPSD